MMRHRAHSHLSRRSSGSALMHSLIWIATEVLMEFLGSQYLEGFLRAMGRGDKVETCLHLRVTYLPSAVSDPMRANHFNRVLIPYQEEIAALRSRNPSLSY